MISLCPDEVTGAEVIAALYKRRAYTSAMVARLQTAIDRASTTLARNRASLDRQAGQHARDTGRGA